MYNLHKSVLALCAMIIFTGLAASQLRAQATVQATGTVLQPIQMSGTNLSFGNNIFPGIDKQVTRTNTNAAQFDISGEAGKEIVANFTLPSDLTDGANNLPIVFNALDAAHAGISTDQSSATSFDPNSPLTTTLDATSGELYVWLGGTVTPDKNQPAGTYSADITLDIAYTGN
jgi:hypothetical protein